MCGDARVVAAPRTSPGANNVAVNDDSDQTPSSVRVRLFGEVDVEGEQGDRTVRLKPLSRALLARLALAPGERLDTEDLAKLLVVKVEHGTPVGADMLSSAQQQLRNAQWELRKRLGKGRDGARLLGSGRHWVALEGARTDYREFLDAVGRGDGERARTIASRGEFLAGLEDPWTTAYRRKVQQGLRTLGPHADGEASATRKPPPAETASAVADRGSERARAPQPGRSRALKLAALAALLVAAAAIAAGALSGEQAAPPDASKSPPDIAPNGDAIDLGAKPPGRCQTLLPGASAPRITAVNAAGQTFGDIRTYHQPEQNRTCAKLIKPQGSPLHGETTHLALTLCGDDNQCARDWHAYRTDAGPVVVPSRDGCVSWRVSMGDRAGRWPIRDRVGRTGCS